MNKISIGIVGLGEFAASNLDLWLNHPLLERVVAAEMLPDRRKYYADRYHNRFPVYETYDEMLAREPGLTCIGIYSQRHQHGPMTMKALEEGKHVFSAVPVGVTEEEVYDILRTAREKRLIYLMAETCYYFPCAEWCRKNYAAGRFGRFQYGEAQYYHDIEDMTGTFAAQGDAWKRVAGIPPMFYATHSTAMLFSAIDEYPVSVSCHGIRDTRGDGIYGAGLNNWDNEFSNEVALFRMKNGGLARIGEFRRIGTARPTSYITGLYGDDGAYEYSGFQHLFSRNTFYNNVHEFTCEDVSDEINTEAFLAHKSELKDGTDRTDYAYQAGFSPVQNTDRLPPVFLDMAPHALYGLKGVYGHNGSHAFLIDDFVRAVLTDKLPPVDPVLAGYCTLAGLYAHKSALQGGATLEIPDLTPLADERPKVDFEDIKYK